MMNFVVVEIPTMWGMVGVGLEVGDGDLASIQARYAAMPDGQQACFREVISKWRNGATSEYSWKNLVEVLLSPIVNQPQLVRSLYGELKKKYPDW